VRSSWASGLTAAAALLGIAGLLVHLEMRASAQADELKALRSDVAAQRGDRGSSDEAPTLRAPPVAPGRGLDPETIQAIATAVAQLESQRTAVAGPAAAASASARGADTQVPRSAEQEIAAAHATELATQAIAHGRLSRDDVMRIRQDLENGQASDAERDALRSQIAMAINAQKLVPEDPRFLYP
jgi:hypothetical protein